jgi:hypothetical protein
MSSANERVNKIEKILNDVSERVEKLDEDIKYFENGFKDVGDVEEEEEIIETPTVPRDSPDDSRNPEYNGSQPMVQTQLDSLIPKRKPNGQQLISIQGKIRIRLDYLKNAGIPETNGEVIMLNDVLKGNFTGGRRTRRMRRGRVTKRRVKNNKKTKSHKKARSHKKRH